MDNEIFQEAKDIAGLVIEDIKDEIDSRITKQQIKNKMDKLKLELGDMSSDALDKVHNLKDKASSELNELSFEVKEKVQNVKEKATDKIDEWTK